MLAQATLADDGVLLHYEFLNRSNLAYDMIAAPVKLAEIAIISRSSFASLGHFAQLAGEN